MALVRELMILVYATAVGFAASGMISTLMQSVTKRPVAFAIPNGGGGLVYFLTAISFALTGPYIVARATFRTYFAEREWTMIGAGLFIAALWSTCSGILVLGLALSVGGR